MGRSWYPIINEERCVQCGQCIKLCVEGGHFAYDTDQAPRPVVSRPNNCVDFCHGCGNLCPKGAITYHGDKTGWVPPHQG